MSGYNRNIGRPVLAIGDAHGDLSYILQAAARARLIGTATILQLGDLGMFWPGSDRWLTKLDRILARENIDRMVFIGGNHEGWVSKAGPGGLVGARETGDRDRDGFIITSDRTRWADNGHRWQWDGIRFGALGGAFSTDHARRTAGKDWWPDLEAPTSDDVEFLGDEPLDVLVTHEAPDIPPGRAARGITAADEVRSASCRSLVQTAIRNTCPDLVLHGHWHQRYSKLHNWWDEDGIEHVTRLEGLGANITSFADAVAVLDLGDLHVGPADSAHVDGA